MKEKKQHWAKEKAEKKKSIVKIKRFVRPTIICNILGVFFLGVVVYSFVFSDFLEINDVAINNKGTITTSSIMGVINSEIDGKYGGMVSKNNFVFFSSRRMEDNLKNSFRKIKKVTIDKKFPNKITVNIEERNLILTLCSRGECYFIDENGYSYEKVDFNSEEVKQNKIIKLIDESGKEIGGRNYVLLPKYVEFITKIAKEIKDGASVEILDEYRTESRISEEVIAQTNKGWDIYLNSKIPIDKSVQTLKTLLNRQIMLRDLNDLEYIDLRSENKVFYRMKGGVTQEEEETKAENEAQNVLPENTAKDKIKN
jgi:cell division septal protein FtsQ